MLRITKASPEDSRILAQMNKCLIQDEGHQNPLSIDELEARMESWLRSDWEAVLIIDANATIGYALFQWRTDPFEPKERFVYLRQFFVSSSHRRRGVGTQSFKAIKTAFWPKAKRVEVEVLVKNTRGIAFWHNLGFLDYQHGLRLDLE